MEEDSAYVNFLRIMNGAVIQGHTLEMKRKLEETKEELLEMAMADLRTRFYSKPRKLFCPSKSRSRFQAW